MEQCPFTVNGSFAEYVTQSLLPAGSKTMQKATYRIRTLPAKQSEKELLQLLDNIFHCWQKYQSCIKMIMKKKLVVQ